MSSSHGTRLGGRTWYRRVLLGLFVVVVLAAGVFGQTRLSGVAHASGGLGPNGNGTPPLKFQGGWIQNDPVVYLVFWGPDWTQNMEDIAVENQVENTFQMLAGSEYNNILRQYNNPHDTSNPDDVVHNDVRLAGVVNDTTSNPVNYGYLGLGAEFGNTVVGQDYQVRTEAVYALRTLFPAEHITPQINKNTQVIVFPQQGSGYEFPGWGMHSYDTLDFSSPFTYGYAIYANPASGADFVPDDSTNCNGSGCYGTPLSIGRSTAWNAVHEYAEMATDPNIYAQANILTAPPINGSGWNTGESNIGNQWSPYEMADICEGYIPSSTNWAYLFPDYVDTRTGTAWYLPLLWSNNDSACVSADGKEYQSPDFGSPFTGKHTVQGAINTKYQSMGGTSSMLGEPITEEMPVSAGGAVGAVSYFAGQLYYGGYPIPSGIAYQFGGSGLAAGSGIYYSYVGGTHEVHGYIFADYNIAGGPANMGFPVQDEMATPDNAGRVSYFSGHGCGTLSNHMYSSGSAVYYYEGVPNYVWGCIYDRYMGTCSTTTVTEACMLLLGDPVSSEIELGTGEAVNYFSGQTCSGGWQIGNLYAGSGIYYKSGVGTHEVQGCIFTEYNNLGGPTGMGFPDTDELNTPDGAGRVSYFSGPGCGSASSHLYNSGDAIYYYKGETNYVWGCIYDRYMGTCSEYNEPCYDKLGDPVSSEIEIGPGEAVNYFSGSVCNGGLQIGTLIAGSAIYYKSGVGTHEVQGCVFKKYTSIGGPGALGYPTTDEFLNSCGHRESDFQLGKLIYNGSVVNEYQLGSGC